MGSIKAVGKIVSTLLVFLVSVPLAVEPQDEHLELSVRRLDSWVEYRMYFFSAIHMLILFSGFIR